MKIHAYQETYVNKAQSLLGDAFDYAINTCKIPGEKFIELFLVSLECKRIENGEAAILAGKSGIELVRNIVAETTAKTLDILPTNSFGRSKEYWIGWAVAYYQWWTGKKFNIIFKALDYSTLEKMYITLHEADISKFVEIADSQIKKKFPETQLKRIRTSYGCSQSELAKKSGVSLRSIQMYEQRNKDINKANADTVLRLAKVLGCTVEDLIEN